MPVIVQIQKLVAPLCEYSQRIFEESDDNQKPAESWKVSAEKTGQLFGLKQEPQGVARGKEGCVAATRRVKTTYGLIGSL